MIGLCGAHRTGKTTLAREYARRHKAIFVETPTSALFRELGLDPKASYSFHDRLAIQEFILERTQETVYAAVPPGVDAVADRTPLDMLAYTMAEAIGNRVQPEDQVRFAKYTNDCFAATNKWFSTVLLVQPGLPMADEDGKAVANVAYVEHLNSLILGFICDQRMKAAYFYVPRQHLDLDARLSCLNNAITRTGMYVARDFQEYRANGGVLH